MNDYSIFLDDLEIPEKPATRSEIIEEVNYIIKRDMRQAKSLKVIEIDVKPE